MKLSGFFFLFIGVVHGFSEKGSLMPVPSADTEPEDGPLFVIEQVTEKDLFVDMMPEMLNLKTSDMDEGMYRNLQACNQCRLNFQYNVACGRNKIKNPALHRTFRWRSGCEYTCCTNVRNDPRCCRAK